MSEMTATHDIPLFRYSIETDKVIPVGWLCPRCNMVNAPDVKRCECEPGPEDARRGVLPNTVVGPSETK